MKLVMFVNFSLNNNKDDDADGKDKNHHLLKHHNVPRL